MRMIKIMRIAKVLTVLPLSALWAILLLILLNSRLGVDSFSIQQMLSKSHFQQTSSSLFFQRSRSDNHHFMNEDPKRRQQQKPKFEHSSFSFMSPPPYCRRHHSQQYGIQNSHPNQQQQEQTEVVPPIASIVGFISQVERDDLVNALHRIGYPIVYLEQDEQLVSSSSSSSSDNSISSFGEQDLVSISRKDNFYRYSYSKATGMLKLLDNNNQDEQLASLVVLFDPPRWVPLVRDEENILVANGWSFLDPDESEPNSAFDIDAANQEGLYIPKWGIQQEEGEQLHEQNALLSEIGYDIRRLSSNEVLEQADTLLASSSSSSSTTTKSVLLEGATDTPNIKITHNGYDFSGPAGQSDLRPGVFICAIGGLPLFTTNDLSPTTASSGWLSFSCPISKDHVILVEPSISSTDSRIEVLCAKSGCHLGHYFGKSEGYCINASALNFIPSSSPTIAINEIKDSRVEQDELQSFKLVPPISWRLLEAQKDTIPSIRNLYNALLDKQHNNPSTTAIQMEAITFGGGCFWHVEKALRRLPGVINTSVGYAGGTTTFPSYEDVSQKKKNPSTGHAEVVQVVFDSNTLKPQILIDCFLAMHDPTKVRALGKHAQGTGQYRSCIFVTNDKMEIIVNEALKECSNQLQKVLSTEVYNMGDKENDNCSNNNKLSDGDLAKQRDSNNGNDQWFWIAEERHQRHSERTWKPQGADKEISTLMVSDWLLKYARRSQSIWGSSQTIQVNDSSDFEDDGMARMMI